MRVFFLATFFSLASFSLGNENHSNLEFMQPLEYLYKVLSYRFWNASQNKKTISLPAEDSEFIHFSTEEQLEKTLNKYWKEEPQLVILKVDVEKLVGNLVYETSANGSTKYFHLYDGYIPIGSLLESKVVYRKPIDSYYQDRLSLVEVGDPVLRIGAKELSVEEILSHEIQGLIQEMIDAMRAAPGVGLAAPQIGKPIQIVVVEDMDHSHLTQEQIEERDRRKFPLQVMINPKLFIEDEETAIFFEGCLSVPSFFAMVPRAKSVRVECHNEKGERVTLQAKGWHARILQHEIDHLHGTLFIDRSLPSTITTEENYVKLWKGKTAKEVLESLMVQAKCDCAN